MPYRIEHWSKPPPQGYETAKTKAINYLSYVPLPNKMLDADYAELLTDHEDGPIHFAVFVAMLQWVSLQHKSVRNGWLTRNGRPEGRSLNPTQIARLIRISPQHVTEALKRLEAIGWVKFHESASDTTAIVPTDAAPSRTHQGPGESSPIPPHRIELNRIEQKNAGSTTQAYVTFKKRRMNNAHLKAFDQFWEAFGYKKDRSRAADAWLDIDWPEDSESKNVLFARIIKAAKTESSDRRFLFEQRKTPIYPEGWISHRRWEDE